MNSFVYSTDELICS